MKPTFSMETWIGDREVALFGCQNARRGDRWTFCVARTTLEEISPEGFFDPASVFDSLRGQIYEAARQRMRDADARVQQNLTFEDIVRAV